jgi:glycyl-tRNA synthetase beta chain
MPDFLLEIGCEEIPARMLDAAWMEMAKRVTALLMRESLFKPQEAAAQFAAKLGAEAAPLIGGSAAPELGFHPCATPRRLALLVPGVAASQPDVTEQVTGPSFKVAFKDGKPTPAAEAFAKKTGVDVAKLEKVSNPKGEYLAATVTHKGRLASAVLAETLPKEISAIYWPKNMYWREGKPERFVRPIRWIVALLDGDVIPVEFAGIKAGRLTRGHRILSRGEQTIAKTGDYVATLTEALVVVSKSEREHRIRKALDAATRAIPGARWREDAELLNTVVNLTEWPSAILGNCDPQFLSLPEEVLVTVMRDHQKYFAVEDAQHKLMPHFLAVLNTDGDPGGLIRHGNERVLRARFNDAQFFWNIDQKTPLMDRVEMLKSVTFQKDLGSYFDKTSRVIRVATNIAASLRKVGKDAEHDVVHDAALKAKADLTTELVKEFTELQGIVGGLYVRAQGVHGYEKGSAFISKVADAIYDQYKPESTEDSAPRTLEGAVLSIADKADSIAGMFALGLVPSGSKDPFALRRQANGIVKTIVEHKLPIRLGVLITDSLEAYEGTEARRNFKFPSQIKEIGERLESKWNPVSPHVRQDLESIGFLISQFFRERLEFYLRDVLHFRYDAVNAVLEGAYDRGDDEVPDLVQRCRAVDGICTSEEFEPLFVAFKRIKGIVKQARDKGYEVGVFNTGSGSEIEVEVWNEIQPVGEAYLSYRKSRRYVEAFRELSKLRRPVDKYFDAVMVMVDNPEIRSNRLGVLNYLLDTFNTIADLSALVKE